MCLKRKKEKKKYVTGLGFDERGKDKKKSTFNHCGIGRSVVGHVVMLEGIY